MADEKSRSRSISDYTPYIRTVIYPAIGAPLAIRDDISLSDTRTRPTTKQSSAHSSKAAARAIKTVAENPGGGLRGLLTHMSVCGIIIGMTENIIRLNEIKRNSDKPLQPAAQQQSRESLTYNDTHPPANDYGPQQPDRTYTGADDGLHYGGPRAWDADDSDGQRTAADAVNSPESAKPSDLVPFTWFPHPTRDNPEMIRQHPNKYIARALLEGPVFASIVQRVIHTKFQSPQLRTGLSVLNLINLLVSNEFNAMNYTTAVDRPEFTEYIPTLLREPVRHDHPRWG